MTETGQPSGSGDKRMTRAEWQAAQEEQFRRHARALRERNMNAAREVREALEEFEGLLREANPVVASRLLPGITDEELRRLEDKYEVVIPAEVAAVWRWHNGLPDTGEPGCQNLFSKDADFLTLDDALAAGRWRVDLPVKVFAESGLRHPFEGRTFISLLDDNIGVVIDITPDQRNLTYKIAPDIRELNELSVMPLGERVQWWSTALRSGAWYADENGSWHAGSDDKFPAYPNEEAF